ncbi:MAG: MarC family protein [Gammaproteobacteria bacterium]|nr:MarC family protein [Gammaproteobacteria bacterium]
MSNILSVLSVQYTALFAIVNPLGGAFVFFAITRALPPSERERLAGRVGLYTWITLLVALFGGLYLLKFFGITLPVLRVAGGIIVTLTAWQVLTTSDDPMESSLPRLAEDRTAANLAFYPLTMPLTVGPGSISVAITLATEAPSLLQERLVAAGISALAVTLIAITTYLCYRYAGRLTRLLGATGTNIIVRVSGFLLFCIGIQIFWLGARELLLSIIHS